MAAPTEEELNRQRELNQQKNVEKTIEQELLEVLKKRAGISSNSLNDQQDIANVLRDQAKQLKFQNAEKTLLRKTANDLTKIAQKNYTLGSEELGTIKGLESLSKDRTTIEKSIIILKQQQNKFSKSELELDQDIAASIKMQVSESQNLLSEIKSIEEGSNQVANAFGVKTFGAISDITNAIPGLKRFSKPFSDAAEAARAHGAAQVEMLKSGKGLTKEKIQELGLTKKLTTTNEKGEEIVLTGRAAANKLSKEGVKIQGTFMAGVKSLGPALTKALGPLALLSNLFNVMKGVDKEAGEFAKNMGISYDESLALRGEMSKVSRNNKDILVTSKALVETQQSLNQFFGTTVQFSDQLASDFSILSKRTNMTAETQGLIALEMGKTGKTAMQLTKELNLQTFELNNQKGVQMSVKQIQDAVGKTAASLQLTFKGSSKELANQVVSARALGTNLAGVEKISSSLLDFESSIQSELQAELLLGKEINLEKARQAALEGDMGKVAEEVMKNTAVMNAFETKNVIAQEAAAKSLGLSRDELANMVLEQQKLETIRDFGAENLNEAQKKYNDLREQGLTAEQAAAQVGDEALANQLQTASVAARFEAIMLRVQEIFIGFAEPILGIVDGIATMVGGAEHLANILVGIAGTYALIKGYTLATSIYENVILAKKMAQGSLDARALFLGKSKLAQMVAQAVAFAIMNPFTALAGLAVAAGVGGIIYSSMKDGMIGPDGGMIVSGEKGSIQLDKQDSIIAGTDLLGGGNNTTTNTTTTTTSEVDNSEMITLLKNQNTILQKIAAKSSTIEMNGNQVGQEINTSERAIQ
jgi:hypothetical protein